MSEKFFSLPAEKQQAIINAGYRVFSQNSYKKSPMSEIAGAAGISKSLLFHYFYNKKELYLFLLENCARITVKELEESGCYKGTDLFDSMVRGMQAKIRIMRRHPDIGPFVIKAYYEKDPAVCGEIQKCMERYSGLKRNAKLVNFDPAQFAEGIDLTAMYRDMYWASEGYLWEKLQEGNLDIDEMEREFCEMIKFWKSVYLRKE